MNVTIDKQALERVLLVLFMFLLVPQALAVTDANASNNVYSVTVDVRLTEDYDILFKPVIGDGELMYPIEYYTFGVAQQVEFINKTYPFADDALRINVSDEQVTDSIWTFKGVKGATSKTVRALANLAESVRLEENQHNRIVGVYDTDFHEAGGIYKIEFPKFVLVNRGANIASAQEIGHSYGLCDEYITADTNDFDFNDWSAEYQDIGEYCPNHDNNPRDGQLDDDCTAAGCDVQNSYLINLLDLSSSTSQLRNFMGSGSGAPWVDDQTYNHLLNKTTNSPPVWVGKPGYVVPIIVEKDTNAVTFGNIYSVNGAYYSNQEEILSGNYLIEGKDETGQTIVNFSYKPDYKVRFLEGNESDVNETILILAIQAENITRFVVSLNETQKDEMNKTPNTPNVSIIAPGEGVTITSEYNIMWSASDLDNDTISYAVLISADAGDTWSTLDFDLNQTYYELNNAYFSYGTDYQIKVLASDGLNTGTDQTGSFTIIPPPSVSTDSISSAFSSQERQVLVGTIENNGGQNLSYLGWSVETGEGLVTAAQNVTLIQNEDLFVIFEHNYSTGGSYNVTFVAADDNQSVSDNASTTLFVGDLRVGGLSITYQNATTRTLNFTISNNGPTTLTSINWTFDTDDTTVFYASTLFSLSAYEEKPFSITHQYSDSGNYQATVETWNSFNNYSDTLGFEIPDMSITGFSLAKENESLVVFTVLLTNEMTPLSSINWTLNTGENNITGTNISLDHDEDLFFIIEHNYTNYGGHNAVLTATDGAHTAGTVLPVSINELTVSILTTATSGTVATIAYSITNAFSNNKTTGWSIDMNETTITGNSQYALTPNEKLYVFSEYNYTASGTHTITANGNTSTNTYSDTTSVSI